MQKRKLNVKVYLNNTTMIDFDCVMKENIK